MSNKEKSMAETLAFHAFLMKIRPKQAEAITINDLVALKIDVLRVIDK